MKESPFTMAVPPQVAHERCLDAWAPGAWIGAARRAIGPCAEPVEGDDGDTVFEHQPAQWLIALWAPQSLQQPFLRRWPALVHLAVLAEADATAALLAHVPTGARLWLTNLELDWALLAEIVMLTEPQLAPWQHRELAQFILAERQATAEAIAQHYG